MIHILISIHTVHTCIYNTTGIVFSLAINPVGSSTTNGCDEQRVHLYLNSMLKIKQHILNIAPHISTFVAVLIYLSQIKQVATIILPCKAS